MREEQAVAAILNGVESGRFSQFLASVALLFEKCFNLRSSKKNKHLRSNLRRILVSAEQNQVQLEKLGRRSLRM